MKLDSASLDQGARVEILPLIDVVFLLLVFFIIMFLSMTMQKGLPVELPKISEPELISKESVQVSISENGNIAVNGQIVELKLLVETIELQRKQGSSNDIPIIIQGDRKAELGIALQVLERLTLSGLSNIAFAADKREVGQGEIEEPSKDQQESTDRDG